jgi:3-hydroxybutyryl-CoA dehydrogenase
VVEVVRGSATDPAIADRAHPSASPRQAADPLPGRPRLAINRFFCPYTNEAVRLVDEGLGDPATVDRAAREALGAAMGPFAVMNIISRASISTPSGTSPLSAPSMRRHPAWWRRAPGTSPG